MIRVQSPFPARMNWQFPINRGSRHAVNLVEWYPGFNNNDPNYLWGVYGTLMDSVPGTVRGYSAADSRVFRYRNFDSASVQQFNNPTNPDLFNFNAAGDAWSGSAWVRNVDASAHRCIFSHYSGGVNNTGWFFSLLNISGSVYALFQFGQGASNYVYSYGNTATGGSAWSHVAFTYDGSNTTGGIKLYINGVEDTYNTGSAGTVTDTRFVVQAKIGVRDPGDIGTNRLLFKGDIGPIAIWRGVRTRADIWDEAQGNMLTEMAPRQPGSALSAAGAAAATIYSRRTIGGVRAGSRKCA